MRAKTGGVCREVTRFLIQCAGNESEYNAAAQSDYTSKFRKLLTSQGANEYSEQLRSEFSTRMAGLLLGFPVPWGLIRSELVNAGVVVQQGECARFVCPAQERAIDSLFQEAAHDALKQAVTYLVSTAFPFVRNREALFVWHSSSHRLTQLPLVAYSP